MARFHERAAFCCMLFRLLMFFVLRSGEIMVRTSDIILPWIFRIPFLLSSCPKSLPACDFLWGDAVASGDYPLAYPLVLICRHARSYANRNM